MEVLLRGMHLPPGFGFHPSDAELISHYLKKKVHGQIIEYDLIQEVDIYKHEPWDLPSKCNLPIKDNKWHFFASRDRKYPTGARSNRATRAGYWKSTGKDRTIKQNKRTLGTKKTLVFHKGRPPSGKRTEWIMHEYYIDENECQASSDMKDAFVLCRVTRRDDWPLENDNEVGNRNPHPRHLNDACASVIGAVNPKDAAASDIRAGESNHIGTAAVAEQSDDKAPAAFTAHSPNSERDLQACMAQLPDLSPNSAVYTGSAGLSQIEQCFESSNLQSPVSMGPELTDYEEHFTIADFSMFSSFNDALPNQEFLMVETDYPIPPNNAEGTQNEKVQLHQGSCYAKRSKENADNGIKVKRRCVTASSASSPPSTGRMRLQRMVTSNSETINQTTKSAGNNGHMRSFKQSDATGSSEKLSNHGSLSGIKGVFRLSAGFNILFACVCVIGAIAAVLHGYYRSGIGL